MDKQTFQSVTISLGVASTQTKCEFVHTSSFMLTLCLYAQTIMCTSVLAVAVYFYIKYKSINFNPEMLLSKDVLKGAERGSYFGITNL